jgi:hypothetical protein
MLSDDDSLLLNIRVKCSHFSLKAAHISRNLPTSDTNDTNDTKDIVGFESQSGSVSFSKMEDTSIPIVGIQAT